MLHHQSIRGVAPRTPPLPFFVTPDYLLLTKHS